MHRRRDAERAGSAWGGGYLCDGEDDEDGEEGMGSRVEMVR